MSSYRGAGAAWDGGPPGAEADYAGQRGPPLDYVPSAPSNPMPTTDPWTGVSYSQYGAPSAYDYQAYGVAASGYGYNYDASYYQRSDGGYYGKYPDAPTYPPQPHAAYDYTARYGDKSVSPLDSQKHERRSSYRSKSQSASPYSRRGREGSYEERRRRRSRSKSSTRKKYTSSDRSSSRSRSYSHSPTKRHTKKRNSSSESSVSDRSARKKSRQTRGRDHTPHKGSSRSSSSRGRTPSLNRSISKSPKLKSKMKHTKSHSSKIKRQREEASSPPRIKKEKESPKRQKKTERLTLTPPRVYKLKENRSATSDRESSLTPPKTYARSGRSSSKSVSRSPSPRYSKHKSRKRSHSRSSHMSRSHSFSRSRSSTPRRSRSKSKRKNKRKSRSKSRSTHHSHSKSRSPSRRSRSRGRMNSVSPSHSKSRSRSHGSRSDSRSGTPTDDERRGQFTVADRKRFWKLHNNRQEEKDREAKTPPKEKPPPPGAVEATTFDDIEYGDPPEVEGPNFAELLPPPDQVLQATTSKSRPMPIPIKNDGSFLEMFKKMQEVNKNVEKKPEIKKPVLPFIGKRRGGRVLKTGLVKKAKAIDEQTADNTPKDAWSLYMQEVKKYRETSCEEERKTRPLVK